MVKLANILRCLNPINVLVIGDMLLDSYTLGKARRISPEAPVAIVNVHHEEQRPGGAGNVILNLLSLSTQVTAVGRVGEDWAGQSFIDCLKKENVNTELIVVQKGYKTPVKNRIIADNQQIVRIDHEQITPLDEYSEELIIAKLPDSFKGIQIVAISDYGKGFLTPKLLSTIISLSKERGITVITDPKGHDFHKYKGTSIIKPNLTEAYAAANLPFSASLEDVATRVLKQTEADLLMITRSEAGIALFIPSGDRYDFPVHVKEVKDVTGAGDTVLAMLVCAIGNQLSYHEAAQLCNISAGLAIEHVGCARITLTDLAIRLFEHNMGIKFFDQDNFFVLQEVLKQKPYNLLIISEIDQLTYSLYQSIKNLVKEEHSLVIYVTERNIGETFIDILASLNEVDFIVLDVNSAKILTTVNDPRNTYVYNRDDQPTLTDFSSFTQQMFSLSR